MFARRLSNRCGYVSAYTSIANVPRPYWHPLSVIPPAFEHHLSPRLFPSISAPHCGQGSSMNSPTNSGSAKLPRPFRQIENRLSAVVCVVVMLVLSRSPMAIAVALPGPKGALCLTASGFSCHRPAHRTIMDLHSLHHRTRNPVLFYQLSIMFLSCFYHNSIKILSRGHVQ